MLENDKVEEVVVEPIKSVEKIDKRKTYTKSTDKAPIENVLSAKFVDEQKGEPKILKSIVPVEDLKELVGVVRSSYSKSNNREFRLQCKRLEAAISEFISKVENG